MKKKFRTLESKLMTMVVLGVSSAMLIISILYFIENLREKRMAKEIKRTGELMVKSTINDLLKQQENLVSDYAIWDDMSRFVRNNDTNWAKININPIINNYNKDFFAVYSTDGKLLYSSDPKDSVIHQDLIKSLKGSFGTFFVLKDSIPLNLSWSVITSTSDTQRIYATNAYFFVGEYWDNQLLTSIENRTGFKIMLNKGQKSELVPNRDDFLLSAKYELFDLENNKIADLEFLSSNVASIGSKSQEFVFMIAILLAFIVSFFFWSYIKRNVTKPISTIIKSLKTSDMEILNSIKSDRVDDEWDIIVDLVRENNSKTKKLNQEIETKNKFFDLIAHDLKNPFNVILGLSDILVKEHEDFSEDDKVKFAESILESSQIAYNLLQDLLDWARLETGRWNPNMQEFDMRKVIKNVISLNQASVMQKRISLLHNCKEIIMVTADENMIETTIRNLVSNAVKFTQNTGLVEISCQKQDSFVQISVRDNGPGMSPALINSLFKVGEKLPLEGDPDKRGTGLGLVLCKEFVEKHGGKIWVESEINKGSIFHFTIPLS